MDETYYLNGINFVWNAKKAQSNRNAHGISFELSCEVFFDPFLCLLDASRKEEERDAIVGMDTTGRLLFVVHIQQEGDWFRLISARKATVAERKIYESQ